MNFLEPVFGAIVAWSIPRILESWVSKAKKETQELESPAITAFPWVNWCLALTFGGAVSGVLSGVLGLLGVQSPGSVANWTLTGVTLGIAQWWVLKRFLGIGPFWAVGSALGWSLWPVFQSITPNLFLDCLALGLSVGIFQFFLLNRVRRAAFWWIPANMLAWALGGVFAWGTMNQLKVAEVSESVIWIIGWAVVGLTGALILGFALSRLQPK